MRKRIIMSAALATVIILAVAAIRIYVIDDEIKTVDIVKRDYVISSEEDVCGTDRAVTVDGRDVQAYDIGGKTVIAVEDLEYCGQTLTKSEDEIRLTTYYLENYVPPEITYDKTVTPIGTTTVDTISVKINNIPISAYNYNGKHYVDAEKLGELTDEYNREAGWSDYNFNITENSEAYLALESFRFPRVYVPQILEDKTSMVGYPEFELYTESDEEQYFGGMFEPKKGVLAGINADGNGDWLHFEKGFFKNSFAIYSNYIEFDDGQMEIYSPNKRMIRGKDCMLLMPWNTSDITLVYDNEEYIRAMLDEIKSYNRPVIVRYACEMNVSELGDSPTAYVKAFRFVADIVHEYGLATMWSVNDMGALNRPYELYYPGDEYVDWIGVSAYAGHDFMNTAPTSKTDAILFGRGDYGWHTNNMKYIMRFLEENNINKPVAISEGGVESYTGYAGAPTSQELDRWGEPRLANMYWYLPMLYPKLKMITYFNVKAGDGLTAGHLANKDNYISIIKDAIHSGAYMLDTDKEADFSFKKSTETGGYKRGEEIPLYMYSYIPEDYTDYVEYRIDGEVCDALGKIPYKTVLKTNDLTEGDHLLTVRVNSVSGAVYEVCYKLLVYGDGVWLEKMYEERTE